MSFRLSVILLALVVFLSCSTAEAACGLFGGHSRRMTRREARWSGASVGGCSTPAIMSYQSHQQAPQQASSSKEAVQAHHHTKGYSEAPRVPTMAPPLAP